jgi:MFS family permease/branched-subunit amino acid transport protein
MWWLILAGPLTYLTRVSGYLLARTRLVPRQMASTLALVSVAALSALVAPAVLLPQGRLLLDPLDNPRLLVVVLLLPLLWLARRHEQVVLLGAPVGGLALLWGVGQVASLTVTLSLPLALLLFAVVSLVLLVGRQITRRFPARDSSARQAALPAGAVRVLPAAPLALPAQVTPLPAPHTAARHRHCLRCGEDLPTWASYCGGCGLYVPNQWGIDHAITRPLAAPPLAAAPDLAVTQPLAAVTVRPRRGIPAFWTFWTGETISNLGSSFTLVALPLLVFKLTGSALFLGLGTLAEMLPYLCFGLLIGAWVDRLDRKRLMIGIDVCQALVLSSIPLAFFFGWLTVWWIYGVSFVSASLKFAFETGQFAAIPSLVEPEKRVAATGRLQAGVSGAQMLGPILAGALLFLLPLPTLLFINAATFLISACTLLGIRRSFNAPEPREPTSLRQDMIEGVRYVFGHPVLRAISLMAPLCNLCTISLMTQLPLFASIAFHATGWQISVFYTAAGAGLTVFAALAGRLRKRLAFSKAVLGAFLLYGLVTVLLAFTPWYWGAVVLWSVIQGTEMLFNVNTTALRMDLVPNHLLGRVRSVAYSIAYSVQPVGALLGGFLIVWVGKRQVTLVYAGIGLVVFLIALAFSFTALGHAERYLPDGIREPARGAAPSPERKMVVLKQAVEHGPVPPLVGVEGGSHDGRN